LGGEKFFSLMMSLTACLLEDGYYSITVANHV
jgi:hypothetical protein